MRERALLQESGPERDPSSHQPALCDVQKIVLIYQTAVHGLVDVWTDAAGVDHGSTLLLGFGIQEVVAVRKKWRDTRVTQRDETSEKDGRGN